MSDKFCQCEPDYPWPSKECPWCKFPPGPSGSAGPDSSPAHHGSPAPWTLASLRQASDVMYRHLKVSPVIVPPAISDQEVWANLERSMEESSRKLEASLTSLEEQTRRLRQDAILREHCDRLAYDGLSEWVRGFLRRGGVWKLTERQRVWLRVQGCRGEVAMRELGYYFLLFFVCTAGGMCGMFAFAYLVRVVYGETVYE